MASSVFYKFRSQREESRVTFDGTGISVFDLKRDIILANNLGKANDFDLSVFDGTSNQGALSMCLVQVLTVMFATNHLQNSKMIHISYRAHPL